MELSLKNVELEHQIKDFNNLIHQKEKEILMEHQETEKVKIHLENIKERYEEEVERVKGLENELKEERARVEEKLKKIETEHQERPKSKESKSHE